MRGLTQIRGAGGQLSGGGGAAGSGGRGAAILGAGRQDRLCGRLVGVFRLSAAGRVAATRYFHLDPLWADAEHRFHRYRQLHAAVDWRDGDDHADAEWRSIYNLDYLKSNIAGGEGYDWYYHSTEARSAQIRTPITDGAHGEPWVYRYKDIRNWWANAHHDRLAACGQRTRPPGCRSRSPIWFTELGCAAIDKGTNQPNKFLDPKSSESQLPELLERAAR